MGFQSSNASGYPQELYDECVRTAGKSFCDFLFRENSSNFNNQTSTSTIPVNSVNSTFLSYNDNDLGFTISYPSDWTVNNQNSEFHSVVGFSSHEGYAQVDIRVFPQGEYKSIKEYGDDFKESDVTLLAYYRNGTTLLSEKPAFRAIYLTTYDPSFMENAFGYKSSTSRAMFIATMVPEQKSIYAIAYFSNSPDLDKFLPVVEKMLKSFNVYGKGPVIQEDNSSKLTP